MRQIGLNIIKSESMYPGIKYHGLVRQIIVRLICCLAVLISLARVTPAAALDVTKLKEGKDLGNIAYATFLGTGIYKVSEQSIQVYHIPFSYHLRKLTDDQTGIKIKLPVTVGFYDFKPSDVIDEGFPDDFSSLSIVPGIEYHLRVNDSWRLTPYFDLGISTLLSESETSYVYSAGIKSYVEFTFRNHDILLGNKIFYAGYSQTDGDISDDFASFETGLDIKYNWDVSIFGRKTFASIYLANFLYFDDLRFFRHLADPITIDSQNEVGFTVGTHSRERIWLFDLENARVGLGFRFGDNLNVWRLSFGLPI